MSKKSFILAFIGVIGLASPFLNASNLMIEAQVERVAPIQYLPIFAKITMTNVSQEAIYLPENIYFDDNLSFHVQGPQDLSCFSKELVSRTGLITLFQLAPGEKHIYKTEIARNTGMIGPGSYQIKVVWDSRKAPKGYKGYAETEWIPIIVQEATGDDKGYIDAARKAYPDQYKCFLIDGIYIKEGFEKNPTAYYCGHTLATMNGWHGFTWWHTPYENYGFYESAKRDYIAGHSVEMFERLLKANEELIAFIEAFLRGGREDFAYTDDLRANLAGRLAIQGKYERARSICETLISKKSNQEKNCSEFLQHLKEKGYLK